MVHSFKVDPDKLLKFLKLFKVDPILHFRLSKNKIRVLNVDFKDFAGVMEGSLDVVNEDSEIDFALDSNLFLNKLEFFKEPTLIEVDDIASAIKINPRSKGVVYDLECKLGPRITKNLDLNFLESDAQPILEFNISTDVFLDATKAITNVDNLVLFKFHKSKDALESTMTSKRTQNIATDVLKSEDICDVSYNSQKDFLCYELLYVGAFNGFLRCSNRLKLSFRESFLVTTLTPPELGFDMSLLIPLRNQV